MQERRTLARRTVIAGAVSAMAGAHRARAQERKLSKAEAAYQDTPKDDHACGTCTLFQPPKSCQVVAGNISEHGWCKLFQESPE